MPKYVEIRMPKAIMYFTAEELYELLAKDVELWKVGLQRGKAFKRATEHRRREREKMMEHGP